MKINHGLSFLLIFLCMTSIAESGNGYSWSDLVKLYNPQTINADVLKKISQNITLENIISPDNKQVLFSLIDQNNSAFKEFWGKTVQDSFPKEWTELMDVLLRKSSEKLSNYTARHKALIPHAPSVPEISEVPPAPPAPSAPSVQDIPDAPKIPVAPTPAVSAQPKQLLEQIKKGATLKKVDPSVGERKAELSAHEQLLQKVRQGKKLRPVQVGEKEVEELEKQEDLLAQIRKSIKLRPAQERVLPPKLPKAPEEKEGLQGALEGALREFRGALVVEEDDDEEDEEWD